jgi:hypothetical protein
VSAENGFPTKRIKGKKTTSKEKISDYRNSQIRGIKWLFGMIEDVRESEEYLQTRLWWAGYSSLHCHSRLSVVMMGTATERMGT